MDVDEKKAYLKSLEEHNREVEEEELLDRQIAEQKKKHFDRSFLGRVLKSFRGEK